jgi:hypothetical protein
VITFTILPIDLHGVGEVVQVITVDKGHQAHHQEQAAIGMYFSNFFKTTFQV